VKWVFFVIALAAVLPLAGWLRANPNKTPAIWVLVGFMFLKPEFVRVDMALYSWSAVWRNYVQGIEIYLVDLVLLAIYLSLPRNRTPLPFSGTMTLYFLAVLFATFQTDVMMPSLFYVWQLLRMFFVYAVITRASADPRVVPAVLKGLSVALCVQAVYAIYERFGLGVVQAGGSYGNQNLLGMMSHFIVIPAFAMLLAGQRGTFPILVNAAGAILTVLTTSRATVGLALVGYTMVFMLSAFRGWTPRKAKIAILAGIGLAILTPLSIASFEKRASQEKGPEGEIFSLVDESRVAMARAASMILTDHPLGIGPNQYLVVANIAGYNTRAGVNWFDAGSNVHNVYWLVAAETGYAGLIAWLLLLVRPLSASLLCGWRHKHDWRGDLLLGLGVALLVVYAHSYYEWSMVTANVQYLFAVTLGLIAGLAQQLGYWRPARRFTGESAAPAYRAVGGSRQNVGETPLR
jgi:O-Antigen ligase